MPIMRLASKDVVNGNDQNIENDIIINDSYRSSALDYTNITIVPFRMNCSAHSLDLIAKCDSQTALAGNTEYRLKFQHVFKILNQIWAVRKSRKKAEIFQMTTGCKIIPPHKIRWFKMFDAFSHVAVIVPEVLKTACKSVGIPTLHTSDHLFIKEYIKCMKPIADGIKRLEASSYTFGVYLPTLFAVERNLTKNSLLTEMNYCSPLAVALANGFQKRFASQMELDLDDVSSDTVPLFLAKI